MQYGEKKRQRCRERASGSRAALPNRDAQCAAQEPQTHSRGFAQHGRVQGTERRERGGRTEQTDHEIEESGRAVVDLSDGDEGKGATAALLAKELNAELVTELPDGERSSKADLLVLIGE